MVLTVGVSRTPASCEAASTVASAIGSPKKSSISSDVRCTGIMWCCVRCTAAANAAGPYWTGEETPSGNSPRHTSPQAQVAAQT